MGAPHPGTNEYRNQTIRIVDLVVIDDVIQGQRFENCTIVGPAVLALMGRVTLTHCFFDAPTADALFWPVPPERGQVLGAIGVRDTEFYSCRFQRIGFAGPPELRESFAHAERGED
jgi:hypothetical protein